MKHRLLAAAACALIVPAALSIPGAHAQKSAPATVKIDKKRIDTTLAAMVADGRAAGVEALIFKNGREVYFGTAGDADREAKRPVTRDTMFQIYSMTKPVTGVALMQLWEQGKFGLDDPLSRYLPEFSTMLVQDGTDKDGKPVWRPSNRPVLIRDILRHTAGFAYGGGPSAAEQAFAAAEPLDLKHDLTEFGHRLAGVPLMYEPGTRWWYSSAVDVQALLVERFSGMKYEDYARTHILDPLGMKETAWTQPDERWARMAIGYQMGPDKKLVRMPDEQLRAFNFDRSRRITMGGAGLASTADEYMRFARMLLNRGELDGVRILKPSTVRLMATDQLDPRVTERAWLPSKGSGGFGIDFFVRTAQPKTPEENRGAVGEFFWDGAWSTLFWVDPANDLAAVFLVQSAPFDGTMHHDFRKAVYGADYLGPAGD